MQTIDRVQNNRITTVENIPSIDGDIFSTSFSPDSKYLYVGCKKGKLFIINCSNFKLEKEVHLTSIDTDGFEVDGTITCIIPAAKSKQIIAISTYFIALLDYQGHVIKIKNGPFNGLRRGQLSPNEELLLATSDDKLIIYEFPSFSIIKEITVGDLSVPLVISPDGQFVYVSGENGKIIKKICIDTGEIKIEKKAHYQMMLSLALNKDGSQLISSGEDFRIKKWNTEDLRKIRTTGEANGKEMQIKYSPDFSIVGTACLSRRLSLRDPDTLKEIWSHPDFNNFCICLSFSPDGNYLAAGENRGGELKIFRFT